MISQNIQLVASHQPHFAPWLKYFQKFHKADIFIFSDDVQYRKGWCQNRNKIAYPQREQGWRWLTVPIASDTSSRALINQVKLANRDWPGQHLRYLEEGYRGAAHYDWAMEQLTPQYEDAARLTHLVEVAYKFTFFAANLLQLSIPTVYGSSTFGIPPNGKTERLAFLTKKAGGNAYLVGAGASQSYFDDQTFIEQGLSVFTQQWEPPGLVPNPDLAIFDAMFHLGPRIVDIFNPSRLSKEESIKELFDFEMKNPHLYYGNWDGVK